MQLGKMPLSSLEPHFVLFSTKIRKNGSSLTDAQRRSLSAANYFLTQIDAQRYKEQV